MGENVTVMCGRLFNLMERQESSFYKRSFAKEPPNTALAVGQLRHNEAIEESIKSECLWNQATALLRPKPQ